MTIIIQIINLVLRKIIFKIINNKNTTRITNRTNGMNINLTKIINLTKNFTHNKTKTMDKLENWY